MAALVGRQITLDLGAVVVVVARGNNGLDTGVEWSGQVGTVRSLAPRPVALGRQVGFLRERRRGRRPR